MADSHRDSVLPPPSGAQSQPEDAQGVPESTESPVVTGEQDDLARAVRDRPHFGPDCGPPTKPPTPARVGGHALVRVAWEILDRIVDEGGTGPVVVLAIEARGDGTYDMVVKDAA